MFRSKTKPRKVLYLMLFSFIVFVLWSNLHLLSCIQHPTNDDVIFINRNHSFVCNRCKDKAVPLDFNVDKSKAQLYGHQRNESVFLVLGVPTVRRQGIDYLDLTLTSLIQESTLQQRARMIVVVFFLDTNQTWCHERARHVYSKYLQYVENGFMQLVHVYDSTIYPTFSKLKRTYDDTPERVAWRTKQNFDYAFMLKYCHKMSTFYIQLEDDIVAEENYFNKIQSYVLNYKSFWFCIEFSHLGFIGKLFRSEELHQMASFILLFYDEQPVDLLLRLLKHIKTQTKDIFSPQVLFHHKGIVSSMTNKRQFAQEWSTGWGQDKMQHKKRFYHYNPTAVINTDIKSYADHQPIMPYDMSDHHFWGGPPKRGNFYNIIFEEPQNISRILIDTGQKDGSSDILQAGILKAASFFEGQEKSDPCSNATIIAAFKLGDVDLNASIPMNTQCLSIVVTKDQMDLLVIREIAVILKGEPEMVLNDEQREVHASGLNWVNKMNGKTFFNFQSLLKNFQGKMEESNRVVFQKQHKPKLKVEPNKLLPPNIWWNKLLNQKSKVKGR